MKVKVLIQGTVSEVRFPNIGKVIPDKNQPPLPGADSLSEDFRYIAPGPDHGSFTVKDVLPGQVIKASLGTKGKSGRVGHLLEVVSPAPYEQEAPCPYAAFCGGCRYQTVPYELQLQWKEQQVRQLLADVPGIADADWQPIVPSPLPLGYRNKMEFSFGDAEKDGPLTLGLHKRGSHHDILETPGCLISHADFGRVLAYTADWCRAAGLSYHNTYNHIGYLRHLVLRRSFADGSLLVNLVTSTQASPDLGPWVKGLLELPLEGRIAGILHTENDADGDLVQCDRMEVLYGEPRLREELLGLRFEISPFSFFQTNSKGAEKLYSLVREFAGDVSRETVFDLYCGTGTIAQVMAAAGASKVYGIELVEEAVEAALENARGNGLENCEFYAGDVLKLVDELSCTPDLIILDPPREGIHPKALPKLLAFAPKRFVYVSCKPSSLARDLPAFTEAGYRVEKVRCCDMFPMTAGVETVALLVR